MTTANAANAADVNAPADDANEGPAGTVGLYLAEVPFGIDAVQSSIADPEKRIVRKMTVPDGTKVFRYVLTADEAARYVRSTDPAERVAILGTKPGVNKPSYSKNGITYTASQRDAFEAIADGPVGIAVAASEGIAVVPNKARSAREKAAADPAARAAKNAETLGIAADTLAAEMAALIAARKAAAEAAAAAAPADAPAQ